MSECPLGRVFATCSTLSHHEDLFFDRNGAAIPVSCSNSPIVYDGQVTGAALIVRDISERRAAEERRQLLINELNHRVKNTLAIVQGIAQQSFKGEAPLPEQRQMFEARLSALSSAHNILTRENWEHAQLSEVIERSLAPFQRLRGDRFVVAGPDTRLYPKMAVSFAMAFHELATNALKYGSLSNEAGRVIVKWHIHRASDGPRLKLIWREEGGPEVEEPKKRGFGSRLIERGMAAELRGTVKLEFLRSGLTCTVDAPLPPAVPLSQGGQQATG
jgi:two-component sensor histidine kinase